MGQRRGPLGPPVLGLAALLLLAGCGAAAAVPPAPPAPSPPPAPAPSPSPTSSINPLIAQLGSPSFPTREAAEKKLTDLAPDHYAELERARELAQDPEIQTRLDRILSSPRIILAAAWHKAKAEDALGPALGERWFRLENESVPVGYGRFSFTRESKEGRAVLRLGFEEAHTLGNACLYIRIVYLCDEAFNPLKTQAVVQVPDGDPPSIVEGVMTPEGWEMIKTAGGTKETLCLPWTPADFPQEVMIPLLPLWVRAGKPGREILFRDIEYPTMLLKPLIVRDEGKGKVVFYQGRGERPYFILALGEDGGFQEWDEENLRGLAVDRKEGAALKKGLKGLPETPAEPEP